MCLHVAKVVAHGPDDVARTSRRARSLRAAARRCARKLDRGETRCVITDRQTLGAFIAERRRALGMSQGGLAKQMDVSRTIVSAWENDHRRPPADRMGHLGEVLEDDGELARLWARPDDRHAPPLFDAPVSVTTLRRQAVNGLVEHLSADEAADQAPGYGWRFDLDDASQSLSALSTAYGLKAVLLAGGRDWRVSLPRIRAMLRRLEMEGGGWSATKLSMARPEITAVVVSALHDAGDDDDFVASRIDLLLDGLRSRVEGPEPARPYVLTTSLLELSRLGVDLAIGRRFIDDLIDLSTLDGGERSWPMVVKASPLATSEPSTVPTAGAVCALAAWARRLSDDGLHKVADEGRCWLERHSDLALDDEWIRTERPDGGEDLLAVRHFTPAWVLRAVADAGGDPSTGIARRALREMLSYYVPETCLWRWPRGGGSYPVWMTYHALAALMTWACAAEVG
jgi:transcriptional regulator with XRE-family HTH domain